MGKFLKGFANEFVFGAHLVSLGASGILLSIIIIFDLPLDLLILVIGYLVIQIIYRYNHFRELDFDIESNPERVRHLMAKKRWVQVAPFLFLFLLILVLFFADIKTAFIAFYIVVVGMLYTEFFKKIKLLGFKNYYAAHFWAVIVLLIPSYYALGDISGYLYLAVFIFIRGIINTAFFDLKDIEDDRKRGIRTFPTAFGKKKALFMMQILNLLSLLSIIIGVYKEVLPVESLLLSVTVLFGVVYLYGGQFLKEKSLRMFSYVVIDGEYLIWPLVIYIGKFFI